MRRWVAAQLDVAVDDAGVRGGRVATFQIQEFRRPEFEVVTRTESAGPHVLTKPVTVAAVAQYFSGGVLADAPDGVAGDDQLDDLLAAELVAVLVRRSPAVLDGRLRLRRLRPVASVRVTGSSAAASRPAVLLPATGAEGRDLQGPHRHDRERTTCNSTSTARSRICR